MLYNATANFNLTSEFVIYAGYTRGLEESGSAPPSAANRGEAMPANLTKQVDVGFRFSLTPRLQFVTGVFQVEKPCFNVNAANIYGPLGAVRHRGVEMSLAGQVLDGLTIVGGVVLLEPRLSGEPVDRGAVGHIPIGPKPRNAILNVQYLPVAWNGFGVDGQINSTSAQMAHSDNLLKNPAYTQFNLGARYNFNISEKPASLRVQMQNVSNSYAWNIGSNGAFFPRTPRRVTISITADF